MIQVEKNEFIPEDKSLFLYLKSIAGHKVLSAKEEAETAKSIRKGDKRAVEKLVKANLRFVVSVARNYQNQGMPLSDIINEGNLGLIRAAYRFNEKKNFKFISYAVWWIRQAILQGLADHSRIVRVPLNRVAIIHKVGKVRTKLEQRYRRIPNDNEVANEMGIKEDDVTNAMKVGSNHASLDAPINNDEIGSLIELLRTDDQDNPDNTVEKNSINREVERVLGILTKRECIVVHMYFGIGEEASYTLEEIGRCLGITRERVRQIKDTALKKLRRSARCRRLMKHALY